MADSNYYRLIWLTGATAGERTTTLREFSAGEICPLLDVGKALSKSLLDVSPSLRASSISDCFADLMDGAPGKPLCLDHLEILHEPSLRLNPIDLIKNASRHRMLIASWPGSSDGDDLVFGPEGHPAYLRISREQMECHFLEIHP